MITKKGFQIFPVRSNIRLDWRYSEELQKMTLVNAAIAMDSSCYVPLLKNYTDEGRTDIEMSDIILLDDATKTKLSNIQTVNEALDIVISALYESNKHQGRLGADSYVPPIPTEPEVPTEPEFVPGDTPPEETPPEETPPEETPQP